MLLNLHIHNQDKYIIILHEQELFFDKKLRLICYFQPQKYK